MMSAECLTVCYVKQKLQTNKMADIEGESSQVLRVSCADKENLVSYEPCQKKAKLSDPSCDYSNRLEDRLNGILCCAVCLDLPHTCYQVG